MLMEFGITGPLGSRAAKAIGFIDMMIDYSLENSPTQKELTAGESSLPPTSAAFWCLGSI